MITLLVEPGTLKPGRVPLTADDARHAVVRRAATGDPVRLLDGAGGIGTGTLADGATAAIERVEVAAPPVPLQLGVGAGDRERFTWLVEKCAELPVTDIVPLDTRRARAVATRLRPEHLERLRRKAREAIKQSGNPFAPEVHDLQGLQSFVAQAAALRFVAQPGGGNPGSLPPGQPVTVAIGPEGGWDADEEDQLRLAGFQPLALGPHILRFETAALAAAALVWHLRQS